MCSRAILTSLTLRIRKKKKKKYQHYTNLFMQLMCPLVGALQYTDNVWIRVWLQNLVCIYYFALDLFFLDYYIKKKTFVIFAVSEIFSDHLIKLFWYLTVVVGLIKLYYIRIFVFSNLCLSEYLSIYFIFVGRCVLCFEI